MTYDRSRFIGPPWGGWNDSAPAIVLPHNSFKQITGWLINQMRLQQFPSINTIANPPDGNFIQGAETFVDVLGLLHTGVLTKDHVYYLNGSGYSLQGATSASSFESFSTLVFLNRLFYANGVGVLNYLDGGAGVNVAGNAFGSCHVLGKLAGSLLMLNLEETSGGSFPLDIRYSGVNNPLQWDATLDVTAGRLTIPEVEDSISGFTVQRSQGVIFRAHGISILSPTGSILPRFSVSSFEDGPTGVGNAFGYALGSYGDISIFPAEDDIYMMAGLAAPQKIGGPARKQIYSELSTTSGSLVWGCMMGRIAIGVPYLAYWLAIPLNSNGLSSVWIFHLDDQTWVNEQLPLGAVRWLGSIAVS